LDVITLRFYDACIKSLQKRATVYLDSELHRALRVKAAETGQPIPRVINDATRLSLAEDAEDLAAFEERVREPNLPFEVVLKDLRKRGKPYRSYQLGFSGEVLSKVL
jgi:hypothetical protein